MPLYRITSPTTRPFRTWGRTAGEAALSFAEQLYGTATAVHSAGPDRWQAFQPGQNLPERLVGQPFTVQQEVES